MGNQGGIDIRNFQVVCPYGGSLKDTEFSWLAQLSSELGVAWTAMYAKQGAASYAAAFNGKTFFANGNVGIGTMYPDARLAVNGIIHSKEVKVDLTGWPDYVFKATYELPELDNVKAYIERNFRLPEMH